MFSDSCLGISLIHRGRPFFASALSAAPAASAVAAKRAKEKRILRQKGSIGRPPLLPASSSPSFRARAAVTPLRRSGLSAGSFFQYMPGSPPAKQEPFRRQNRKGGQKMLTAFLRVFVRSVFPGRKTFGFCANAQFSGASPSLFPLYCRVRSPLTLSAHTVQTRSPASSSTGISKRYFPPNRR